MAVASGLIVWVGSRGQDSARSPCSPVSRLAMRCDGGQCRWQKAVGFASSRYYHHTEYR